MIWDSHSTLGASVSGEQRYEGVRVPFVPRVAVVTIQPFGISHMRDRDAPPILRFPGNFQDPINQ
jgi:hypothetical protein